MLYIHTGKSFKPFKYHLDVAVVWLCGVEGHATEEGQDAIAALHRALAELHEGALVA